MNYFSAYIEARRSWFPAALLLLAACGVPDSQSAGTGDAREYSIHYLLRADPSATTVHVDMHVEQPRGLLRELSFPANPAIRDFSGDGEVVVSGGRVRWFPPADGGSLSWNAVVHNERDDGSFDALLGAEWGLFRMEDVIPRARTRTLKGSVSRTTLSFDIPAGWSAITEYSAIEHPIVVDRPARRFDQPAGWVAMGNLGVRRETIAGTRVAVAGPSGHDVRRLDMLALLNWALPELKTVLPDALPRLTIVSAGEPMWRGGLSAPASLFLHADRPLISENATSSLLHEVMHVALGIRPRAGHDWIAEGLAEYYSIELLRRGRAITARRADEAFRRQVDWSKRAGGLCGGESTAATTARAVTIFAALQKELAQKSDGEHKLDDVLQVLAGTDVDLAVLTQAAEQLIGETPDALHIDKLAGCRNIQ